MKKIRSIFVLAGMLLAGLAFTGCNYNGMVQMREDANAQWATVESQYQRRADLIPNLVATVKGYAAHEEEVYASIADARSKLGTSIELSGDITEDKEKFAQYQKLQSELGSGLSRLMAITENYPALRSNENFLTLQSQLEGTENRIATERKRYNDLVKVYNAEIQKWPNNMYAKKMGFQPKEYYQAEATAAVAPKVEF